MSRERFGEHDFYEFVVRFEFSESVANVPGVALLTPHVYGYAGEKNTWIIAYVRSSCSQPHHPASNLHSLNMCSDLIQIGKVMIWDTLASEATSIHSPLA